LGKVLLGVCAATLIASIVVVAVGIDQGRSFPWGTHMVTVTAVLLLGVIAGWWMRERQVAEDRAREEINANRKD
jgi:fluoride ion exporter CrcB/FEX